MWTIKGRKLTGNAKRSNDKQVDVEKLHIFEYGVNLEWVNRALYSTEEYKKIVKKWAKTYTVEYEDAGKLGDRVAHHEFEGAKTGGQCTATLTDELRHTTDILQARSEGTSHRRLGLTQCYARMCRFQRAAVVCSITAHRDRVTHALQGLYQLRLLIWWETREDCAFHHELGRKAEQRDYLLLPTTSIMVPLEHKQVPYLAYIVKQNVWFVI